MSGIRWSRTPTAAFADAATVYAAAIRAGVRAIADRYAPEIEAHMKANATWTDRTGNARQTLNTQVEQVTQDMVSIILAHGMEYGIFLELANGGAYAVIAPTIDEFGPRIWADVRAMLA